MHLHSDEYHELVEGIKQKREEREDFIKQISEQLKTALKEINIECEITGRAKHFYSIYKKMKRDNKTLEQIYDLFAVRIITNSVQDCYAALGKVHELYTPMPGRFKDFIAMPKPNMYQSIHTTLIGKKGTPFEVQIRTRDMHRIAEYGIAAHWAYKEGKTVTSEDEKLSWIREALKWEKDARESEDFMKNLKTELFEDEVFVFTPKGDVKSLPVGSTPIDLAYAIHAEVGHKMIGAKINSKIMPIATNLQNGDIVEIITSDNSKGPSRDWLKFVKSSQARNKINGWFKKALRAENIEKGKTLIERELKRIGLSYSDLFKPEWIEIMLKRFNYNILDDMYSSVGFGGISPVKIIARLLEEYKKEHKEEEVEQKLEELKQEKKITSKPSKTGIVVEGIDNCLVKLSKCCNPLPGDEIIGYITKGRGVSVHTANCINAKELVSEDGRLIDVYWYNDVKGSYNVEIETFSNDRVGLLADILSAIYDTKAKLMGVNTKTTKEKIAIINVTLEVEDTEQLNRVLKALRKVNSVYEVKRKK